MPTEHTDSHADPWAHAPAASAVPWEFINDDGSDPDERIPYALCPLTVDHPPRLTTREALQLVGAPA